ncbi:MAG: 2-hydroxyacyl-CoA dehydratase family protein [Bacillota bacterium]
MNNWPRQVVGTRADELLAAAALPYSQWRDRFPGHRPFPYFCSYWPEELVMALGWEPVRVLPPAKVGTPARLPTYCCTVARGCLEEGEAGRLPFEAAGFAQSCDTMQCLSQIWRHAVAENSFTFVPPVDLGAAGALRYCAEELAALGRQLEQVSGRTLETGALARAIKLNNRLRKLLAKLEEMRPWLPSTLAAELERAAQIAPRAFSGEVLEAALPELERLFKGDEDLPRRYRRVVVSGAVLEGADLFGLLEELGARVVADDSCTGRRHFAGLVDEDGDPLEALAARCLRRPPCPCRHQGLDARLDYLLELARSKGAEAVILVLRKYCDPHAWDAVYLTEGLRGAGVPAYVLELEGASPGGQEKTRLQAFLECL